MFGITTTIHDEVNFIYTCLFLTKVCHLLQRMDRSGTGSRHRRTPSISHRLRLTDHQVGPLDSLSNASLMEVGIAKIYIVLETSKFTSFITPSFSTHCILKLHICKHLIYVM